jgi:redox-sensitive bicupin YhaK (pirin superfamily)
VTSRLTSPARHDTSLVGTDLDLRAPATVPLRTDFEYALIVLEGAVAVHGRPLLPGRVGYLGEGRDERTFRCANRPARFCSAANRSQNRSSRG